MAQILRGDKVVPIKNLPRSAAFGTNNESIKKKKKNKVIKKT
jgi:hypothetical protein